MSVKLQASCGIVALIGLLVDDIVERALESLALTNPSISRFPVAPMPYHITVISEAELRELSNDQLTSLPSKIDSSNVFPAGVGANPSSEVFFVVIIWAIGQQLRKRLGLPPVQFHITLSNRDDPDIDKGIDSLLPGQFPVTPAPDFLDHLAYTLHSSGQYEQEQPFCVDLILALPDSHRGFLRMGDAARLADKNKLGMLSYACAFQRTNDEKVQRYCIKQMVQCSKYTEWGAVFMESEISQLPDAINSLLLASWSTELRSLLSDMNIVPDFCLEPRERLYVPHICSPVSFLKLPRNFRWLIPFHIAIMSTPRNEEDIATIASSHIGIRHVLTLTEETPLCSDWFTGRTITNTYLPIPNFGPPSVEQMDIVMRLVLEEDKLPLLIHCGGGKGRAGTVAACYLAAYGFQRPRHDQTYPEMSANEAVTILRAIRPGTIETPQQESFVSKWCSTIWSRRSVLPDVPCEPPPCSLEIEGSLDKDSDLFILVGLPGSGKSWFSSALRARNLKGWTVISQDDSGRASCETDIGRSHGGRLLLDRCNTDSNDRKAWLELASSWVKAPVCVWFDYDPELCTFRAQCRVSHPTLRPGGRVRNAVAQMRKVFVRPTLKEGFKAVVVVRSFAASQELVLRLSPPVLLFKFPRTPHLLNLGAATPDDIIGNLSMIGDHDNVVITEKVDGANMGFSLSDRRRVIVQNRAHFVNSATHEQFKKLDLWVERHREDLFKVLDRDEQFAERYILFGEWLYATHSIPYTHLPGCFMAFDLYDRGTETWASRKTLSALLSLTSIPLVPVIYEGKVPSDGELRSMIQQPSKYYDGRVEGIYLKVERNGMVVNRGKVVREDFIPGNEHWTRAALRVNRLASDETQQEVR